MKLDLVRADFIGSNASQQDAARTCFNSAEFGTLLHGAPGPRLRPSRTKIGQ